jgi:hypothetical protein
MVRFLAAAVPVRLELRIGRISPLLARLTGRLWWAGYR